ANRRLVERVLEPCGYRLLHASDGQSGIDMALQENPDLILLDMGLPDMDGQTLVSILRETPSLAGVRFVALAAGPEKMAAEMAYRYGCNGCVAEPLNVAEFPKPITTYLSSYGVWFPQRAPIPSPRFCYRPASSQLGNSPTPRAGLE